MLGYQLSKDTTNFLYTRYKRSLFFNYSLLIKKEVSLFGKTSFLIICPDGGAVRG